MLHLSQVQQLPKILERQTKAVFPLYLYLLLLMCRYFTALRLLEATMIYYLKSSECFNEFHCWTMVGCIRRIFLLLYYIG